MSDRQDKDKDKKRFVQQYVDRQRAYLPTYTTEQLFNESHQPHAEHGTTRGDDGFGFDTPVLRPRVRAKNDHRAQSPPRVRALAGPSKSLREHEAERGLGASPEEEPSESETQDLALGKKQKKRSKPKEPSTPIGDTDDERTARLADRRERKRKKRAIVDPPGKQERDRIASTTASKKGKANQKTKKPAALALLYGFSATNVTKDRLTLKPAPALGVFSKGKASAKKKVTTARKPCTYPVDVTENAVLNEDSAARNESFSETAFLNKSSERTADLSNTHNSDDSSPDQPISQEMRKTKRAKKDCKCTEGALKTPRAPTRTIAESEIWDIELQSKLPSSVRDVSSELAATNSAPVVLDVRGVEWSASLDVVEEQQEGRNKTRTPNLSIFHSPPRQRCSSPLVRDEGRHAQVADISSIHPSHSASQVGCRAADSQPHPVVPSKYFAIPKKIPAQKCSTHAPQLSRSNDDTKIPHLRRGTPLYSQELAANAAQLPRSDVDVQLGNPRSRTPVCFPEELEPVSVVVNPQSPRSNYDTSVPPDLGANPMVDLQTTRGAASPINSLTSVLQPMVTFQTTYDMVGLDLTGPSSPYDDYYGHIDTPRELLGGRDRGYFECSVVESVSGLDQDLECHDPQRGDTLGYWYRSPAGLATYDAGFEDTYDDTDPLAPEYQADEPISICFSETLDEDDPAEGEWFHMDETEQDFAGHEDETESIYYSEEGLDENVIDFLEGRTLLLGVEQEERRRYVGMTALVQAEMDVANRLRDHWRPLRL